MTCCDLWDEECEVDDAVAGGSALKGSVRSHTEKPSVPGRGDGSGTPSRSHFGAIMVQRMPTMAGLPVAGRIPRMKTGKVVPKAANS